MLPDVLGIVLDIDKSQGVRVYDSLGKRWFLDCKTYVASNPLGHNHPKFSDPAFEKKLLSVAKSKPANSDFYTVELAEFVQTFGELAMPKEFPHLFLIEGGSQGVENALKASFDWKVRKNLARGEKRELGSQVIHFREAFHGRSGYTVCMTNTADPRKTKYFPKFNWPRIVNPKAQFPIEGVNLEAVKIVEQEAAQQIREAFAANPGDIAAIIIEPIQGEGGDNHFRPEFHQMLRKLADENEAMLIYDEVQTGVGLTGKMWAYQHYGIVPDIVCFGKKMQVCGMMVGRRIDEVADNVFHEKSRINSTWGGNLVDMVRAARYLEVIHQDKLVENARVVGTALLESLRSLQARYPTLFSNARGEGLMCAIDVSSIEKRDKCVQLAFDLGALILRSGVQSLRLRPPLIFTKADVEELMSVLDRAAIQLA